MIRPGQMGAYDWRVSPVARLCLAVVSLSLVPACFVLGPLSELLADDAGPDSRESNDAQAIADSLTADSLVAPTVWRSIRPAKFCSYDLNAVWGTAAAILAVGDHGAWQYAEDGWTPLDLHVGDGWHFHAVWGRTNKDVFVGGGSKYMAGVWHFDGNDWVSHDLPRRRQAVVYALWGNDSVLVAAGDRILQAFDGYAWSPMAIDSATGTDFQLRAVWGTSATNIIAVGYWGQILRYDGTSWREMTNPSTAHLFGVWGTSAKNVYAVGNNGTVVHFDGSEWKAVSVPDKSEQYTAVWGASEDRVIAVGRGGTASSFNGLAWDSITIGAGIHSSVWGVAGSLYLVGSACEVYQRPQWPIDR